MKKPLLSFAMEKNKNRACFGNTRKKINAQSLKNTAPKAHRQLIYH